VTASAADGGDTILHLGVLARYGARGGHEGRQKPIQGVRLEVMWAHGGRFILQVEVERRGRIWDAAFLGDKGEMGPLVM
jgi:hypothetical protein